MMYGVDAGVVLFILFVCFWVVFKYLCCSGEQKLGFIYLFYSFAIILCSLRIAQSTLVLASRGTQLQDKEPDEPSVVNILNNVSNALTFLFGCVIVYNTYILKCQLKLIPSITPVDPRTKKRRLLLALLFLSLILITCSGLVFFPDKGKSLKWFRIILWATLSTLFLSLAVLYLFMYCDLRSTLKENVFNQLDSERSKMRLQFFFFGFGYVCRGVAYGVMAYLWAHFTESDDQNYLFIIYMITAGNIIVADALPILFIACVHNSTFRDIQKTKEYYKNS